MKLNVFGRKIEVCRENDEWTVYSLGEGKRRQEEIAIPSHLKSGEVVTFIADLFHESATPENPDVQMLTK